MNGRKMLGAITLAVVASLLLSQVALAWDCKNYNFNVSRGGGVTVRNGSSNDEPSQEALVFINGVHVDTFDVPALKAGEGAKLGNVSTPGDAGFDWEVEGTTDCSDSGQYDPIATPPPPPTNTPVPTDTPPHPSDTPVPTATDTPVPTSTDTPVPTETREPPTLTPTPRDTEPPRPSETPVPTATPTETLTPSPTPTGTLPPSPTPTDTPLPTDTPMPTATPTEEPPPTDEPPEEEEVEAAVACYDPEVEIELRRDPESGYERLWRIWTEDGEQVDELDLFRLFEKFDTVLDIQDASIEPNSRCEIVISAELEFGSGKSQHNLFVFGSTGSYYRQLTDSEDKDELSPEWLYSSDVVFSENGLLYLTDSLGRSVQPFEVDGEQLAGDAPAVSPRSDQYLTFEAPSEEIVTLDLTSGELVDTGYQGDNPAWTPDGSGLSWSEDGKVILLNLETGEVTEVQEGERVVWSPEQGMEGYGHLDQNDQRWWLMPDDQPLMMTGETPVGTLSADAEEAFWADQVSHEPLDWEIDPQFGQQANLSMANEWLTSAVASNIEAVAAQTPVCPDYTGDSLVDCLKSSGMDASFEARAQRAVEYGLIDNVDQYDPQDNGNINWELLNILRGT